jgi:hypothetical protein
VETALDSAALRSLPAAHGAASPDRRLADQHALPTASFHLGAEHTAIEVADPCRPAISDVRARGQRAPSVTARETRWVRRTARESAGPIAGCRRTFGSRAVGDRGARSHPQQHHVEHSRNQAINLDAGPRGEARGSVPRWGACSATSTAPRPGRIESPFRRPEVRPVVGSWEMTARLDRRVREPRRSWPLDAQAVATTPDTLLVAIRPAGDRRASRSRSQILERRPRQSWCWSREPRPRARVSGAGGPGRRGRRGRVGGRARSGQREGWREGSIFQGRGGSLPIERLKAAARGRHERVRSRRNPGEEERPLLRFSPAARSSWGRSPPSSSGGAVSSRGG